MSQLERICKERESELARERENAAALQIQLEERNAELETMRKKLNREQSVNGTSDSPKSASASPSKQDLVAARDEIKGLK